MSDPAVGQNVTGYVLGLLVKHLAPASRLLTPSANHLVTSSDLGHCAQPRFVLDFRSDEGKASAQAWHNSQGRNTRFKMLEYRKHKEGQFKHEFVVVWLNSTTLCRFDRRARDGERGHVLRDEGAPAEDSVHVLSSFETEYNQLIEQTEVLLTINLPRFEDLGVILAVCEGVQMHAKAAAYNLIRYNCYFFTWMIVAAIARRTYNWESNVLSKEGWEDILQASLGSTLPDLPIRSNPVAKPRANIRMWFSRIFSKLRVRPRTRDVLPPPTSTREEFQVALRMQYSNSYSSVESILSKLLLRSQLGPALKKGLTRIESSNFASAKCDAAADRVRRTILQADTFPPILCLEPLDHFRQPKTLLPSPHINRYRYSQVMCASKAVGQVLMSGNKDELSKDALKDAWMEIWCRNPGIREQYEWLEDKQTYTHIPPPQLAATIIQKCWREWRERKEQERRARRAQRVREWFGREQLGREWQAREGQKERQERQEREARFKWERLKWERECRERLERERRGPRPMYLTPYTSIDDATYTGAFRSPSDSGGLYMPTRPVPVDSTLVAKRPAYGWILLGDAITRKWETMGEQALPVWESAWDECGRWYDQYAILVTTAVTDTLVERLGDMAAGHLVFGNNTEGKKVKNNNNNSPSLQEFIRSRMQEHFQMVDKYGFGSSYELISKAEKDMCEIWVTSLDIIESSRYQPQYTTNRPTS